VTNFVKIGRSIADITIFQDGGRPPCWICLGLIWTTHEEYLVVSITVPNLVVIYSSFDYIKVSIFDTFRLKTPIHAPQNCGFAGFYPTLLGAISMKPQKAHPYVSPRRVSHKA